MKINTLTILIVWLIGMILSVGDMQGSIVVTSMTLILIFVWFLDDSLPVNPTNILYEGKKFKTLTQLIDYVKKQ